MNWSNFLTQGDYGFYVWGSYIVTLIVLGAEVFILLKRRKALPRVEKSESSRQHSSAISTQEES